MFAVNLLLLSQVTLSWEQLTVCLPAILLLCSVRVQWVMAGSVYGLLVGGSAQEFSPWHLFGLPVAWTLSLVFSGLIHCASHGSLRPRTLNRPVGELLGLAQLSGFADWNIVHILHHSHTDDPVRDPHPPQNLTYWQYTKAMRALIVKVFVAKYFQLFGASEKSQQELKAFSRNSKLAHINKVVFWFLLLKSQIFFFLFAPSIVAKMFQFSWLNWAAHRPGKAGVEIRNLEGAGYRYLNIFSFGLFVHKNHHLVPTLFNPKSYDPTSEKIAS